MNWKVLIAAVVGGCAVYVTLAYRGAPGGLIEAAKELSDPVPPAHAELSGSRLQAKVIVGADGSEIFEPERLYDSTLDADCEFRIAGDGVTRCLPTLSPGADAAYTWYFSDSQCTNRIAYVGAPPLGCAAVAPKYVYNIETLLPTCEPGDRSRYHIYETGTLLGTPSPVYDKDGSGNCRTASAPSNRVAFALTSVPASTFVEGTAGIDP